MHQHGGAEGNGGEQNAVTRIIKGEDVRGPLGREARAARSGARRSMGGSSCSRTSRSTTYSVHLHPFAESLQLRDITTGDTVLDERGEK